MRFVVENYLAFLCLAKKRYKVTAFFADLYFYLYIFSYLFLRQVRTFSDKLTLRRVLVSVASQSFVPVIVTFNF